MKTLSVASFAWNVINLKNVISQTLVSFDTHGAPFIVLTSAVDKHAMALNALFIVFSSGR